MSTHNIHFHDKIRKLPLKSQNICFLLLLEDFPKDSKTSSSHRGYNVIQLTPNRKEVSPNRKEVYIKRTDTPPTEIILI